MVGVALPQTHARTEKARIGETVTKLSRERLMKIHGISEPTGPADPAVLARRKYHEAAVKWLDRISTPLLAIFAFIGVVFVLLPVLVDGWRVTVEKLPLVCWIFEEYSTIGTFAMVNILVVMILLVGRLSMLGNFPGGIKASALPSRHIMDLGLYPRTRKEEIAFWLDFSFELSGTTFPLFLFGGFSLLLRG
jgi:hypothetical protein